jgi:signal peptidase I
MENQLFFIGLAMGAYAWLARGWKKVKDAAPKTAARRHALFYFLGGFSAALILSKSLEWHESFVTALGLTIPVAGFLRGLLAGAVLGAIGYASAGTGGGKAGKKRAALLHEDAEWADTVFSAALMASLLMMFVAQAFKIPSASMEKTLLIGDYLFVNKFLYGARMPVTGSRLLPLRPPKRGDIVVFQFPDGDPAAVHCASVQYGTDFVKRLIGEPGDKVEVREGRVILNDQPLGDETPYAVHDATFLEAVSPRAKDLSPEQYQKLWETHRLDGELQDTQRDFFGPVTVPPHSYFMMGDNRDHSCDSRFWGPVAEKDLKGNAWFRYWPPSRAGPVR